MNDKLRDRDEWSSASESLFRSARGAHDPTPDDRARLDAKLSRVLGADLVSSLESGTTQASRPSPPLGGAGLSTFGKLVLVGLGVAVTSYVMIQVAPWFAASHAEPAAATAAAELVSRARNTNANAHLQLAPPTTAITREATTRTDTPQGEPARAEATSISERVPPPRAAAGAYASKKRRGRRRPRAAAPNTANLPTAMVRETAREEPSSTPTELSAMVTRAQTPGDSASTTEPTRPTHGTSETAMHDAQPSAAAAEHTTLSQRRGSKASVPAKDDEPAQRDGHGVAVQNTADDARAELALIERMHAALRGAQYATVMALSTEHAQRWPHGMLEVEREGVHAIAACSAHAGDAHGRASRFLASHPHAPVAARVRTACREQLSVGAVP